MKFTKTAMLLVSASLMVGCASNKPKTEEVAKPALDPSAATSGIDRGGNQATAIDPSAQAGSEAADLLSTRVIYFDFDSAQIRAEDIAVVNAHGRYLADNASAKIRLEGHADERGSREYNVALSEYRANAVANLMRFQGVRTGQIDTVAFGEEKPAEIGRTESAWSRNRRVEIVYEAQ